MCVIIHVQSDFTILCKTTKDIVNLATQAAKPAQAPYSQTASPAQTPPEASTTKTSSIGSNPSSMPTPLSTPRLQNLARSTSPCTSPNTASFKAPADSVQAAKDLRPDTALSAPQDAHRVLTINVLSVSKDTSL